MFLGHDDAARRGLRKKNSTLFSDSKIKKYEWKSLFQQLCSYNTCPYNVSRYLKTILVECKMFIFLNMGDRPMCLNWTVHHHLCYHLEKFVLSKNLEKMYMAWFNAKLILCIVKKLATIAFLLDINQIQSKAIELKQLLEKLRFSLPFNFYKRSSFYYYFILSNR